jgi:hypothetical protein
MALTAAELAALQARLDLYYAAEASILRNQSYEMPDGRKLTRASLKSVQEMIQVLENRIAAGQETPVAKGRARRGVIR